jgi:YD repeat-containing protein
MEQLVNDTEYNTVFIDPLSVGLDSAANLIFKIRRAVPELVFVLYINRAIAEENRADFYQGERRRFLHYFVLDKGTSIAAFPDELQAVLQTCQAYLSWRMSEASLSKLLERAKQAAQKPSSTSGDQLRPQRAASKHGVTFWRNHDVMPTTTTHLRVPRPTKIATTLGRFTKTSYDGLGRTIRVETGDAGTKSQVDTVYGPCGCTRLGKMIQQSMPYAPGATPVWTTYTHDAIGRTLAVTAPDNSVTSAYSYQGNTVSVKDASGRWKQFRMDGMGNVTSVVEPNPAITPMPLPPAAQTPVVSLGRAIWSPVTPTTS